LYVKPELTYECSDSPSTASSAATSEAKPGGHPLRQLNRYAEVTACHLGYLTS
jgi:hypothetical protein